MRQSVNTILNRKPILVLQNGAISCHEMARGKANQAAALTEIISSKAKAVTLHYFENSQHLQPLVAAIRLRFSNIPMTFRELGPVLGIHIGTSAVAVSWEEE